MKKTIKSKSSNKSTVVSSEVQKYTTLTELEKTSRGPIYVRNNLREDMKGLIAIPVARRNGNGQDVVRIPPTFIPIDLTLQVGKAQLMDSTDFRQTVQKGLIRLLTREYAEMLLDTPMARKESQRVAESMSRAKIAVEAEILSGGKTKSIVKDNDDDDDDDPDLEASDEDDEETKAIKAQGRGINDKQRKVLRERRLNAEARSDNQVQPSLKFKRMIKNCLEENKTQTEILIDLKNSGQMEPREIRYAARYFKTFPRVMKYLEERKGRSNP